MEFDFARDYKFKNEEDAKKFFETVEIEVKYLCSKQIKNTFIVTIYATENKHVELDAFCWENKKLWESYLGSFTFHDFPIAFLNK